MELQLLASSPHNVNSNQELPTLERSRESLEASFGDSGIGKSMSSQVGGSSQSTPKNAASSLASKDQGFINQSPISGRFQMSEDKQMETMFSQQQRERQWLVLNITRQNREAGEEIAEFEEALGRWVNRCPLCKLQKRLNQHQLKDCTDAKLEAVLYSVQSITKRI